MGIENLYIVQCDHEDNNGDPCCPEEYGQDQGFVSRGELMSSAKKAGWAEYSDRWYCPKHREGTK